MRKILLLTEGFYDYDYAIQNTLVSLGYDVELFQTNVSLSYMEKVIYRKKMNEYLEQKKYELQKEILWKGQFDIVLVISGHFISPQLLHELREKQSEAKFIYYLWDNIARVKNFTLIRDYFDRIITFDRQDSINYDLPFRPLFFLEEYKYSQENKKNDVCFLGWLHSGREAIVNAIIDRFFCNKETYIYFVTGYYTYIKEKILGMLQKNIKSGKFLHVKKLGIQQVAKILLESKITIDIHHETQKGLTMRTLESMAANTKIITTNEEVSYYDFYNKKNICIIERNNIIVDEKFLKDEWEPLARDIVEKYSVKAWAKDVLADEIKNNFLR